MIRDIININLCTIAVTHGIASMLREFGSKPREPEFLLIVHEVYINTANAIASELRDFRIRVVGMPTELWPNVEFWAISIGGREGFFSTPT